MSPGYTREFYASHEAGARSSAGVVVPMVMELLSPRSVVDVGCGTGVWARAFRDQGVEDVVGIDGGHLDPSILEIPSEGFLPLDLSEPFRLDRRFDLVVCLEVAEHLPEPSAGGFVASLVGLGDVVLFSAAIPHQGGTDHLNEQWAEYWAERFAGHGYVAVDRLRRRVWGDPRVEWWYQQNLLLFVDERRLPELPQLARSAAPRMLSVVHPHRYLEWVEWGLSRAEGEG